MEYILKNAKIYVEGELKSENLYIKNGLISEPFTGAQEIDLKGLVVLPGMIDSQVHFREPGLTHKEDIVSGSRQALLGGVTGFFEMPNTVPPTTTLEKLDEKLKISEGKVWSHCMYYVGATTENIESLVELEKAAGSCGVKIFMGSSTGSLLVSQDEDLEKIVSTLKYRFAVHSENEDMLVERKKMLFPEQKTKAYNVLMHTEWRNEEVALSATQRMVSMSKKYKAKLHLLHVSTKQEMEYLKKEKYPEMSVELTPQHLTLSAPECYELYGTNAQMNPPIRTKDHQDALWKALNDGLVDTIGSDHAPHTFEEKTKNNYPSTPSGLPGVQTTLPLMLNHVSEGRLSLKKLVDLFSINPAKLFNLKNLGEIKVGRIADLTVVDLNQTQKITKDWLQAKVGWSPFENKTVKGWPVMTFLKGHIACRDGEIIGGPKGKVFERDFR